MYAIVESGGKQYKVSVGETYPLELLDGKVGDVVELKSVLMVQGDQNLAVGSPFLSGASVVAEIVGQGRGEKVIIFKKKRRKNYQRTQGHRQFETRVKIQEIRTGS
jgi:large subunit ribosomal protein L21